MAQTLVDLAPTTPSTQGTQPSDQESGRGPGTSAKTPAPRLSSVRLASKSPSGKSGIALKLALSQAATIKILITQTVKGHKYTGACRPTVKKGRTCTVTVRKRSLVLSGSAGANTLMVRFAGLQKGSYTATIVAVNANGKSRPITIVFTLPDR